MKVYVGITDGDWYRFLEAVRPEEVNFWQPGGARGFKVLEPGGPFLFKLHAPDHFIVGGGYFLRYVTMPVTLAWQTFEEKNGAPSFLRMRDTIERYRRDSTAAFHDYEIGCILLTAPFFFDEADWIPIPGDWGQGIMRGKSYDTSTDTGASLWAQVEALVSRREPPRPRAVGERPRAAVTPAQLTEGAFRLFVTEAYERRCAVTRQPVLPVLETTHIKAVSAGGEHRVDNGLLMRSDLCRLFDLGYVTVSPDCRFRASRRIKDEFHNGMEYLQLDGSPVWVPRNAAEQPNRELLAWHSDVVFRG